MNVQYAFVALFFISQMTLGQTTESLPDPVGSKTGMPREIPVPKLALPNSGGFSLPDSGLIRSMSPPLQKSSIPNGSQLPAFGEGGAAGFKLPPIPTAMPDAGLTEPGLGLERVQIPGSFAPQRTDLPALPTGPGEFSQWGIPGQTGEIGFPTTSDLLPVRTIPARIVGAPEFHKIDSLSKLAGSRRGKLSMQRQDVEEGVERIVFRNKPSLRERMYFEGLVGVDPASGRIGQFAPALGTRLGKKGVSLGAGPNFTFDPVKPVDEAVMGIRGFMKYEFPGDKVYLQAEDSGHFLKGAKSNTEGAKDSALRHVPSIGGGYVVKLREGLGLNLMMLYRIGQAPNLEAISPFQLRMGVSSLRNTSINSYPKKQ